MMSYMRKDTRSYSLKIIYFFKLNQKSIILLMLCSILAAIFFFFITDIPFFYLIPVPLIIFIFFKKNLLKNLTILSKLLLSLILIFLIFAITTLITMLFLNKTFIYSLLIFFYSIIFSIFSFIIYYIFTLTIKEDYLFLGFSFLLSFICAILIKNFILSLIIFCLLIFAISFIYFSYIDKAKYRKNSRLFLLIILIIFAILSFFIVQIANDKKEGNLLTEYLFKFNFNDQINLKSDYNFKGILLFIAKIDKSRLLKAVSYPLFSREKGFYFIERDLPFPSILSFERWEDKNYIKGERLQEEITVYNLNLKDGIVFAPNEPYKIVPYQKIPSSKFTSIFSAYSKTLSNIEDIFYDIDFTSNTLGDVLYHKYTDVGKKDPKIEELIESNSSYYADKKDFIIFYYYVLKQKYFYSISTIGEEGYDGIISFLFKTKKGYCAHFASAYALLLRYFGIPARVVGGFKAIEDNKILNYYRFYDFNAHSWVEIYTDKYGWVPIDPTSDRIAEDEMLPFEKPLGQDESSLLEEILKLEKQLVPQTKKAEIKKEDKNGNKIVLDFNNYIFLFIIFGLLIIIFIVRKQLIILFSIFFPSLLFKSLNIYIKRIAKLLKKAFITAEQLKEYKKNTDRSFDDFAMIYNNLLFAPKEQSRRFLKKKYSILAYKSYKKIVITLKKLIKNKQIQYE